MNRRTFLGGMAVMGLGGMSGEAAKKWKELNAFQRPKATAGQPFSLGGISDIDRQYEIDPNSIYGSGDSLDPIYTGDTPASRPIILLGAPIETIGTGTSKNYLVSANAGNIQVFCPLLPAGPYALAVSMVNMGNLPHEYAFTVAGWLMPSVPAAPGSEVGGVTVNPSLDGAAIDVFGNAFTAAVSTWPIDIASLSATTLGTFVGQGNVPFDMHNILLQVYWYSTGTQAMELTSISMNRLPQ